MRNLRVAVILLILVVATTAVAAAGPGKPKGGPPLKGVKVHAKGESFCPRAALVVGSVVIAPGRCYLVYALRDSRGTFLAFAAPDARIPPGQLVRLNTPAGAKLKGRIFYLVPVQPTAVLVPMNSVTLIAFRMEDRGSSMTLVVTGGSTSVLSVTFAVRL